MKKIKLNFALLATAGILSAPVFAQSLLIPPGGDAGALQQRQIDEERRRREQERLESPPAEPLKRPPAARASSPLVGTTVKFEVREIRFTSSAILSVGELESVAVAYRGRLLTLDELQGLADTVNELYRAKGVVTALATLPPQDVSGGVIEVRLVEGRVGKINISGNGTTRESYINLRVGLEPEALVELKKLEEGLIWFNRTNDVSLQAALKPGLQFARTDIDITAEEPALQQWLVTLDNLGSNLTGERRLGTSYRNRSLFGFRDELSLSYTGASGQESWALSYAFPFNRWGGRLSLSSYDDRTAIKYGPLASLSITGRSHANVLGARQPVYVSNDLEVNLTAGAKRRDSSNFIGGVLLLRTDSKDASVGAEVQGNDKQSLWGVSYTYSQGRATVLGATSDFRIHRGSARYNRDLSGGLSMRANANWQLTSDRNLLSSEQFYVGGEGSVRGYGAGAYSGDQGYTLNLELHHPVGTTSLGSSELAATGFFFVDYGQTRPFRPPNSLLRASEHLTGVGWGVNAKLNKQTSLRLTLSHGLDKVPLAQNRGYQVTLQAIALLF